MLLALSVLLLALQVVGPFDQNVGPFDQNTGPFGQNTGPFDPGPRPWERDVSENVVRQAHRGPFDGHTSLWVRVRPKADDPRAAPTTFLFVAEFPGKVPRTRPQVTWQADTNFSLYPLVPRVPRFDLSIDGGPLTDLLATGGTSPIGYCCDDNYLPASATVALRADLLDGLASATSATGNALGLPFTLDRQQLDVIAEFRRRLLPASR